MEGSINIHTITKIPCNRGFKFFIRLSMNEWKNIYIFFINIFMKIYSYIINFSWSLNFYLNKNF